MTASGRGRQNKANGFKLYLPDALGDAEVSIGREEASVRLRPKGRLGETEVYPAYEATGAAVPKDTKARRYGRVFGGADLLYESTPRGLKETIVLSAPSKKNTFSFDLACPGLAPSLDASGSVLFTRNSTGEVLFRMVPPFMTDSSVNGAGDSAYSDAVHYELEQKGPNWRLDVVADDAWLTDSARVYPVMIDPTTYWEVSAYNFDAFVTSSYPSTKCGYSTELKVGRYKDSSTDTMRNRTYVKPALHDSFIDSDSTVLSAKLRLFCWTRAVSGAATLNCARVGADWNEADITWNNQPATDGYVSSESVASGSWSEWDVTWAVRQFFLGEHENFGFQLYSPSEDSYNNYWSKFRSYQYAGETSAPVIKIVYTSAPEVKIVAPAIDTPVSAVRDQTIRAHWIYSDVLGKKQTEAQVQVSKSASGAEDQIVFDSGETETTSTVMDIVPEGGTWPMQTRYYIRMRVWGEAKGLPGASRWTAWQPFERKALTSGSDMAGLVPAHATDPVGAGLSVDLATGHLVGSRSDFAGPGLGLPITYGATYDSSRTVDEGLGAGWKMGASSLTYVDQKAPNPGFEQTPLAGNDPAAWFINDPAHTAASTSTKRNGNYALWMLYSGTVYGNVHVSSSSGAAAATPVSPGERISASAWVKTSDFEVDDPQKEHGALLKFHFFDGAGVEMEHATYSKVSEGYSCANSGNWKQITLEAQVPKGASGVQLNLELRNAKGSVYFDDVEFRDKTIAFTDGDGTSRTLAPAEGGTYRRDPLEPSVAFSRTNVARSANGTASTGGERTKATDGIVNGTVALNNYDPVDWKSDGSAHLTYELSHAQVLSQADLYLYDPPLRDGASKQPVYTYRIETSEDGKTFTEVVPVSSGRGWMKHSFAPVRARYVRVVALGNTYDIGFRLCEIELPQLRLGDAAVCFGADGKLQAAGDLSGNRVNYTYDAAGRLTGVADATRAGSAEATRGLDLQWSGNRLDSLDWRGVSSDGVPGHEQGIVRFESTGSQYRILRTIEGSETAVLTYRYDGDGHIVGAHDAEGVGFTLAYEGGRVKTVTRSGDPTPTVTTYTYATINNYETIQTTHQVTIASAADGLAAPTRVIDLSASLGYQATKVTVIDPVGADPTTSIAYDEYGHPRESTDALGRITRTERDGHGNVLVSAACDSTGKVLQQSSAEYNGDHISKTVDSKDNESSLHYDDAWRVLGSVQAVSDDIGDGGTETRLTYDEWGNRSTGSVGGSSAYNLLRNGTFEATPTVAGNGWDGTKGGLPEWASASTNQGYLGRHDVLLSSTSGAEYLTSDEIAVDPAKKYTLSAWVEGSGQVIVNEYDGVNSAPTHSRGVLQSVSPVGLVLRRLPMTNLRRVSVTYIPSAGTKHIRIRPYAVGNPGLEIDNIRFELANSASPDCFVENESFERVTNGVPDDWTPSSSKAVHKASSDERVSGAYSAYIGHTTTSTLGYFYGPKLNPGAREGYMVSVSMMTKDSKGGAKAIVRFFGPTGTPLPSEDVTITGDSLVKGTTEWCRYMKDVGLPRGAASLAVNLYHEAGGGSAYWDAVTVAPVVGISTTEYDAATHSVAVKSTSVTGVSFGSASDSRGRVIDTSITPLNGSSEALSAMAYDDLDRLTGVETAPGAGLGITAGFTYTAAGRLETVTGPRSAVTTMTYDAAGRLTDVVSPLQIRSLLRYDALGRLLETFWPRQSSEPTTVASRVTYDSLGRTGSTDVFAEDGSLYARTTPTYDLASRVTTTVVSGQVTGTVGVTYDDLDRAKKCITQGPVGTVTTDVTFEPDSNLPVTVKTTALEGSRTVNITWAKTGEFRGISSGGQAWSVAFGTSGGLTSVVGAGLAMQTRSYDIFGRLEAVRLGTCSDTTPFSSTGESTLTYDARDRIDSIKLWKGLQSQTDGFGYDRADRLTAWNRSGASEASATYAYDSSGNLTTATVDAATTSFSYDIGDRLTGSAAGSTVTTYTNDLLGRRTSAINATGTTTFAWDPLSHLTAVTTPDTTAIYAYGPTGMREIKTVTTANGTTSTRSVYTGTGIAMELDSDGTRYTYLWGPGRLPLSVTRERTGEASETFAYQVDAVGSVIGMTDESGTVVARYSYDPWGRVTDETAIGDEIAFRNPLRYRSYYHDAETGLYYMPARFYDPMTYRFLSEDPEAPGADEPGSLNAFAYCGDDPIGATDPSGARADLDGDGKVSPEEHKALNQRDKKAADEDANAQAAEEEKKRLTVTTLFVPKDKGWDYQPEQDEFDRSGRLHWHFWYNGGRVPWIINRNGKLVPHGKGKYHGPQPPDDYVDEVKRKVLNPSVVTGLIMFSVDVMIAREQIKEDVVRALSEASEIYEGSPAGAGCLPIEASILAY